MHKPGEAAFALMQSIQSPQMLRGILIIDLLQDATARPTRWEWFQWLAERMQERESGAPPVPAHIQHRKWMRPS